MTNPDVPNFLNDVSIGTVYNLPVFDRALCIEVGLELFFPDRITKSNTEYPKSLCRKCPELQSCREWALLNNERYGIWGATTPDERDFLKGMLD